MDTRKLKLYNLIFIYVLQNAKHKHEKNSNLMLLLKITNSRKMCSRHRSFMLRSHFLSSSCQHAWPVALSRHEPQTVYCEFPFRHCSTYYINTHVLHNILYILDNIYNKVIACSLVCFLCLSAISISRFFPLNFDLNSAKAIAPARQKQPGKKGNVCLCWKWVKGRLGGKCNGGVVMVE